MPLGVRSRDGHLGPGHVLFARPSRTRNQRHRWAPKVVNFTFNADGQYTAINRYANLTATQLVATSTYGYNADGAMTSLSHDKGGTNLQSYTWSYDHMGRLTADTIGAASDSFSYDAASEVTAATHSGGGNESYSYDSNGNRTNTGYSTGTNNQLSSDGTYNYLYDNEGNLTKKTTISTSAYVTYTWDYRNRLTDVQAYNSSNVLQSHEHYIYDVFNRLIERQVDPTGGGTYTTTQAFIYSGADVILVYNGSGTLTDRLLTFPPLPSGGGSGWGANNSIADENGSGAVSWMLTDREGTTVDVVQYNSGTNTTSVVDHLVYASFGNITSQTNSTYQPLFAYTGQMWDAAASLYYYHARWFDPSAGRFISQDPTGFAAGDANLYRYVGNSPTNFVDPTGLAAMPGQGSPSAFGGGTGFPAVGPGIYGTLDPGMRIGRASGNPINEAAAAAGFGDNFAQNVGGAYLTGGVWPALGAAAGAWYINAPVTDIRDNQLGIGGYVFGFGRVLRGEATGMIAVALSALRAGFDPIGSLRDAAVGAMNAIENPRETIIAYAEGIKTKLGSLEGQGELAGEQLGQAALALAPYAKGFWPAIGPKPACFVAGTPVLVAGPSNDPIVIDAGFAGTDGAADTGWCLAAAGILVGLAIVHDPATRAKKRQKGRRTQASALLKDRVLDSFDDCDKESAHDGHPATWSSTIVPEAQMQPRFVFEFTRQEGLAVAVLPEARHDGCVVGGRSSCDRWEDNPSSFSRASAELAPRNVGGHSTAVENQRDRVATRASTPPAGNGRDWPRMRVVAGLVIAACCIARGLWGLAQHSPTAARLERAAAVALRPAHVPIESLRVGQRVLTDGDLNAPHETALDPATWRHLRLEAILPWEDGTQDVVKVETLQPPEWIAEHGAQLGASAPMPLDLTEMGIPEDLPTRVVGNDPCPPLETGRGRVVTSTITHLHPQVVEVSLQSHDARRETVRPTAFHKFYSDSRSGWVSAGELRDGERLRGAAGTVTVAGVVPVPGVHRVYNMSVEFEHVYRVSALEVLVHNPDCLQPGGTPRAGTRGRPDHIADVKGPGQKQAAAQARPGETVLTEQPVEGHPGINRRADNQVIGTDGKTRVVVESERRPNGPYHKARVAELTDAGIEVQTRVIPIEPK